MQNRKTQADTSFSPDDSDIATWALPEGAIARLGRGRNSDVAFSPDGQYFAVGTSIARRKSKTDYVMFLTGRTIFSRWCLVAARFAESAYPFVESRYW